MRGINKSNFCKYEKLNNNEKKNKYVLKINGMFITLNYVQKN
jgi:hypothetical protein